MITRRKKSNGKEKATRSVGISSWLNAHSGFLIYVLILTTIAFGAASLGQQNKILSPLFVNEEYQSPRFIMASTMSSFTVWNHGYYGGPYTLRIGSEVLYFSKDNKTKERRIEFSYFLPQDAKNVLPFYLHLPEGDNPPQTSFSIELIRGDGMVVFNRCLFCRKFCYQLDSRGIYISMQCP